MSLVTTSDDEDGAVFKGGCGMAVAWRYHGGSVVDRVIVQLRGSIGDVRDRTDGSMTSHKTREQR